jgi:hypothetical protein
MTQTLLRIVAKTLFLSLLTDIPNPLLMASYYIMSHFILRFVSFSIWLTYYQCQAFIMPSTMQQHSSVAVPFDQDTRQLSKNDDNEESLDELLDKSYFAPDEYDENDSGPLAWFANLVKSDYELAETLYVASFFVVLVIITQELLRMQLYGDGYIPFTRLGAGTGNLF